MKKISFIIICIMFLSLIACTSEDNVGVNKDKVVLTPSLLFEDKALEQHLGISGTAVDFEYHGEKKVAAVVTEIWENGQPILRNRKMSTGLNKGNNKCSFSTKNIMNDDNEVTSQEFVAVVNGGSIKSYVEPIPDKYSWSSLYLHDVTEYSDDEEMIVYGAIASKENLSSSSMLKQSIEEAGWAFVVKLVFLDNYQEFNELNSKNNEIK